MKEAIKKNLPDIVTEEKVIMWQEKDKYVNKMRLSYEEFDLTERELEAKVEVMK